MLRGVRELSTILFEGSTARPGADVMARLVLSGVGESDILAAGVACGFPVHNVQAAAIEVDTLLPFIRDEAAAIQTAGENKLLLFAARDAENLHDYYVIANSSDARLMPASKRLLRSSSMAGPLASRFFTHYGLSKSSLENADHFLLVDTGFRGSVAEDIDYHLRTLYGIGPLALGKLAVRLVCAASKRSLGPSLIRYRADEVPATAEALPHMKARLGAGFGATLRQCQALPERTIATSLQLLPKYHEVFSQLAEEDGRVIAQAAPRVQHVHSRHTSCIDPLAAAIVQHKVVSAALASRGRL